MPGAVQYLYDWLNEIHGRSGVTESGLAPATYATIEAWARMTRTTVTPSEVRALMHLDTILLIESRANAPKAAPTQQPEPDARDERAPRRR